MQHFVKMRTVTQHNQHVDYIANNNNSSSSSSSSSSSGSSSIGNSIGNSKNMNSIGITAAAVVVGEKSETRSDSFSNPSTADEISSYDDDNTMKHDVKMKMKTHSG